MKLIYIDSKATPEDFLTLIKTELTQFLRKCNGKKSVVTRTSLRSDSELSMQIYGVNSAVDDDVKYDKDLLENRGVPLISKLNTGWSSKENIFPQISHKECRDVSFKKSVR